MRLLIDMNLTPRWVPFLRSAGYEAVHWSSAGSNSAKDSEICDYARTYVFVILTNDLDFPQILAHTRQAAPSVVLLRGEPLVPEARGSALLGALQDCEAELNQGAIVTLDWSDKPRARVLPLR
jgi:predicted nuclease of predicted toxin-antitoxin system